MRSMWDRIFETPLAVDKVARMVTSTAPWWAQPIECDNERRPATPKVKAAPLSVSECADICAAPPPGIKDHRGRRSKHHVVVGFAHRVEKNFHGIRASRRNLVRKKYGSVVAVHMNRRLNVERSSTWFVLREDGAVSLLNSKSMAKKLVRMDENFQEDKRLGYA